MPPANSRPLTARQRDVMERIDRRVPIKVIAQELGVSETRINQHIRALKDNFGASSLNELVEMYRAGLPPEQRTSSEAPDDASDRGLSESAYTKKQLSEHGERRETEERVDQGELVMSDVAPLLKQAPWLKPGEPKVDPGVLDGEHAVFYRFAAIIGIALGMVAALVLLISVAVSMSEALDGRAAVPVDEQGNSG